MGHFFWEHKTRWLNDKSRCHQHTHTYTTTRRVTLKTERRDQNWPRRTLFRAIIYPHRFYIPRIYNCLASSTDIGQSHPQLWARAATMVLRRCFTSPSSAAGRYMETDLEWRHQRRHSTTLVASAHITCAVWCCARAMLVVWRWWRWAPPSPTALYTPHQYMRVTLRSTLHAATRDNNGYKMPRDVRGVSRWSHTHTWIAAKYLRADRH